MRKSFLPIPHYNTRIHQVEQSIGHDFFVSIHIQYSSVFSIYLYTAYQSNPLMPFVPKL